MQAAPLTPLTEDAPEATRVLHGIRASLRIGARVLEARRPYAEALGLRYHGGDGLRMRGDLRRGFELSGENYSYRYMNYFLAQLVGQDPRVIMDRDAGPDQVEPGLPGDEFTADWVEAVLAKALDEAQATRELEALGRALCAFGVGGLAFGYDAEIESVAQVTAASEGEIDVVEAALDGDLSAMPGAPHQRLSSKLRDAAATSPTLTDSERARLLAKAQAHDAQLVVEQRAREKAPQGDMRVKSERCWIRYLQAGVDLAWDPTSCDHDDDRWRARRTFVPLKQFKKSRRFTQSAKRAVSGTAILTRSLLSDYTHDEQFSEQQRSSLGPKMVEVWIVEIKEPGAPGGGRRVMVTPEIPDAFIQADDENPFTIDDVETVGRDQIEGPEHGESAVPGFYTIEVVTPVLIPEFIPERTWGKSLIEPGWSLQIQLNELSSIALGSAKRERRVFILDARLRGSTSGTKLMQRLERGDADFGIFGPPGVKPEELEKLIHSVNLNARKTAIEELQARVRQVWGQVQGLPAPVMAMMGTSGTAAQDQFGIQAGDAEIGMIVKAVARSMTCVVRGMAGIIREFYDEEKVRRMLGREGGTALQVWRKQSLEGDRIRVLLGNDARRRDLVDREQILKGIDAINTINDRLGAPVYDAKPLLEAFMRSMDLGKPQKLQTDSEDPRYLAVLEQLQQMTQMVQELQRDSENLKQQAGGAPSSGAPANGTPGPDAGINAEVSAPTPGNLIAGAGRGVGSVPAVGAGSP